MKTPVRLWRCTGALVLALGLAGCVAPSRNHGREKTPLERGVEKLEIGGYQRESDQDGLRMEIGRRDVRLSDLEAKFFPDRTAAEVAIVGMVDKPGKYRLPKDRDYTLGELLQAAGGFSERANEKGLVIVCRRIEPQGKRTSLRVDLSPDGLAKGNGKLKLQEGDEVFVPKWL